VRIWDVANETMGVRQRQMVQLERLRHTVAYIRERVPFYRDLLDRAGVAAADLRSLDDLRRLPFTTKDDFRDNYPCGLFAVPMNEVVRVHSSSGTTGKPVVVGYTMGDIDTWAELIARLVTAAGVTADDVAQIAFGYGMFTGGFGLHYGLERVGATVVPHSAGNTNRQLQFMLDFGTTVLVSTPSYALYLGEMLDRRGVDRSRLKLRLGLFGAEACSDLMRRQIESRLGIVATDNYGLTEVIGPGVSGECGLRTGQHVAEDHFIVEVLDPESSEPVPEGEVGELVFTSLTKEASPVLRYRSRDLAILTREPCACGRTTARIVSFRGRTDDMFIIGGVNVFPSTIESVLCEIEGLEPHYQVVLRRRNGRDSFEVKVEVTEELFAGWQDDLVSFERKVTEELRSALLVRPKVTLVEQGALQRSTGKARRVVDLRESGDGQAPAG
jgi:phenylacetate-CoA ligase